MTPVRSGSRALGHVPIIDRNPRGGAVVPMAPHETQRYNERTAVERFNSRLKEAFGGRNVMVRGAGKVMIPLMFGVVALCADQLLNVTGCGRSQASILTRREWCAHNPANQRPLGRPEARQAHKQLIMSLDTASNSTSQNFCKRLYFLLVMKLAENSAYSLGSRVFAQPFHSYRVRWAEV